MEDHSGWGLDLRLALENAPQWIRRLSETFVITSLQETTCTVRLDVDVEYLAGHPLDNQWRRYQGYVAAPIAVMKREVMERFEIVAEDGELLPILADSEVIPALVNALAMVAWELLNDPLTPEAASELRRFVHDGPHVDGLIQLENAAEPQLVSLAKDPMFRHLVTSLSVSRYIVVLLDPSEGLRRVLRYDVKLPMKSIRNFPQPRFGSQRLVLDRTAVWRGAEYAVTVMTTDDLAVEASIIPAPPWSPQAHDCGDVLTLTNYVPSRTHTITRFKRDMTARLEVSVYVQPNGLPRDALFSAWVTTAAFGSGLTLALLDDRGSLAEISAAGGLQVFMLVPALIGSFLAAKRERRLPDSLLNTTRAALWILGFIALLLVVSLVVSLEGPVNIALWLLATTSGLVVGSALALQYRFLGSALRRTGSEASVASAGRGDYR